MKHPRPPPRCALLDSILKHPRPPPRCRLLDSISEKVTLEGTDGSEHRPCCVDAWEPFTDFDKIITAGPELDQWGLEVNQEVERKCGGWRI